MTGDRNYCKHMATIKLKVARIGNSRGIRLPAKSLVKYGISESVLMEERSDGILLKRDDRAVSKLTWDETAREMAASQEDWGDWDVVAGDGMATLPWNDKGGRRAAEPNRTYRTKRRAAKR